MLGWIFGGILGALIGWGITVLTADDNDDTRDALHSLASKCIDEGGSPFVERTPENGFIFTCEIPNSSGGFTLPSTTDSYDDPEGRQPGQSDFEPWSALVDSNGNVTYQ